MQQESCHHQNEAQVLGVTQTRIDAGGRQFMLLLGGIKQIPAPGDEHEATTDQHETGDMEGAEMRIHAPAKQRF